MKSLLKYTPYLKYLYIPAIVLLVAGGVAQLITGKWTPLYIGLVTFGGILLAIWSIYSLIITRRFWQKRSTQAGTNAVISTVSLVVLLGLINFLVIHYTKPIDLTSNQLYSLSSESQELIKKLNKPVTVWVFDKEPNPYDKKLLENYQQFNPNFKFEYVDPNVKLSIAEEFKVKDIGEVYLQYGDKKQLVQKLVEFNQKQPLSEIKLTNALERIQKNYIPTAYFLQGHGEPELTAKEGSMSQAVNSLKDKGYQVEPLNLSQVTQIPENADVVIVASPKSKLFPQEVATLKEYSDKGGSLLLMIDPNTDPNLNDILKEWGVELDPRIVIDASGRGEALGFGPATVVITSYGSHPITQELNNRYSIYPLTRPIGTVKKEGIEAVSLVLTDDQMWGESDLESTDITFDPNKDIPGPFDIGIALKRTLKPEKASSDNKPSPTSNQSPKIDKVSPENTSSPTPNNSSETNTNTPKPSPTPTQNNSVKTEKVSPENTSSPTPNNSPETDKVSPENTLSPTPNNSPNTETKASESNSSLTPNNSPKAKQEKQLTESKMVVFGNSTFATDGWFNEQFNGDIFLNSVQWLANSNNEPLAIRPKEPENRRINLTPMKASAIAWMSLVIMPLFGLTMSVITWWKRR